MAHATRLDDVNATNALSTLIFFQFPDYDPGVNQRRDADLAACVILLASGNKTGKKSGDAPGF